MVPLPLIDLRNPAIYLHNMQFVHTLIVASEPLLERAIERSDGELRAFYEKHLEEERGHSQWTKEDIEALGAETCFVWDAAQIAGLQYYIVNHCAPEMLLGYMAALERPMPLAVVDELEALHGPSKALRHHAQHDIGHAAEIQEVIERFDKTLIEQNALVTSSLLSQALARIH